MIFRNLANCIKTAADPVVQPNASLTPSKMMELASQGISVTAQNVNLNQYNDGEPSPSFDTPLDYRRGIDVATLWEHQKQIKRRMSKAYSDDVRKFGANLTQEGEQ